MFRIKKRKIASIIMGKFPQYHEDQADQIEWIVLKNNSKTMLLISRYALITTGYCDINKVNQDMCFMEWQNSLAHEICRQFYKTAFSPEEKEVILPKQFTDSEAGIADHVFLLSEGEVRELMPGSNLRKAKPTLYALEKGARLGWTDDTRDYTSWWIMPETKEMKSEQYNAHKEIYPKAVFQNGDIQYHGRNVFHSDFTIRPCILINCEKFFSMSGNTGNKLKIGRAHV